VRQRSFPSQVAPAKAQKKQASKPAAINSALSASDAETPQAAVSTRIKTRRARMPQNESRAGRRKRLVLPDTALRGSVPSGPVVVSAEEVRRSQASKAAQTTRAAEVKQAGDELMSSFNWRSQNTGGRSVDLLLQRLMSIGESTDQGQITSLRQSERFQAATQATAGSKLD
jgi:hypothetical protein